MDSTKNIYIPRDYSQGMNIRFQNKFPDQLEGRVSCILFLCFVQAYSSISIQISSEVFVKFIDSLNSLYEDAERTSGRTCCSGGGGFEKASVLLVAILALIRVSVFPYTVSSARISLYWKEKRWNIQVARFARWWSIGVWTSSDWNHHPTTAYTL